MPLSAYHQEDFAHKMKNKKIKNRAINFGEINSNFQIGDKKVTKFISPSSPKPRNKTKGFGDDKKKKIDDKILKLIIKNKSEILRLFKDELINKKIESETLPLKKVSDEIIYIPIGIFLSDFGAAEILVKYLHEDKKLKFSEIARLINRDQRTIWVNYNNSRRIKEIKTYDNIVKDQNFRAENFGFPEYSQGVKRENINVLDYKLQIPVEVLSDRRLSIFESIVKYLREKGHKNFEIAKILNKDERNIGTFYSRAIRKSLNAMFSK